MTSYWHANTDWGVEPRYFVLRTSEGTYTVEDGDLDANAPPVATFPTKAAALAECRRLNSRRAT